MRANSVAQIEDIGQTHGDDRQRPFALHPFKICDCGPSEVGFEGGTGFGKGDEAPDGDYYNAVACKRLVTTH